MLTAIKNTTRSKGKYKNVWFNTIKTIVRIKRKCIHAAHLYFLVHTTRNQVKVLIIKRKTVTCYYLSCFINKDLS